MGLSGVCFPPKNEVSQPGTQHSPRRRQGGTRTGQGGAGEVEKKRALGLAHRDPRRQPPLEPGAGLKLRRSSHQRLLHGIFLPPCHSSSPWDTL